MTRSILPTHGDTFDVAVSTGRGRAHGLSLQDRQQLGRHLVPIYPGVASVPVPEAMRLAVERLTLAVAAGERPDESRRNLV